MSERPVRRKWLIAAFYSYSALHVTCWWVFLLSNHNEAWFPAFKAVFAVAFLPLNVLTFALCELMWGTTDIFEAKLIVGLVADFAFASLVSATILLGVVVLMRRAYLRARPGRSDTHR